MHESGRTFAWLTALGGLLLAFIVRAVYRIYFHPLSKIPGPKLAAATHLVEFYHDVIRGGKFIWEIESMHEKYGPIVRINPRQVHINDPEFYDEIYAGSHRKRDKDPTFPPKLAASLSVISTVPHEHHRLRRGVLNHFFSKRSVTHLEPIIYEKIDKLADRFREALKKGTVLRLEYAFAGLTADVISHYCYGASYKYLDDQFPNNDLKDAFAGLFLLSHILYFFPRLGDVMNCIPPWLMVRIDPKSAPLAYIRDRVRKQSNEALQGTTAQANKRNNIFTSLVDPSLPPEERTIDRLTEEGVIVLGAGAETTANTLALGAFHLMQNPAVLEKLRQELKQAMPTPTRSPSWSKLEQLPYLSAVVNETLRLAIGGSWRLPRVAPTEALLYKDHVIPPGTPVITTSYFVNMNPTVFPDPHLFDPERWIKASENGRHLGKYIANFTRGTRACVGINLAYAELYLVIARWARQFDMELFETTAEDVAFARDYVVPHAESGPWSVKVKVSREIIE